jgi:hypothetical protein
LDTENGKKLIQELDKKYPRKPFSLTESLVLQLRIEKKKLSQGRMLLTLLIIIPYPYQAKGWLDYR